MKTEKFALKCLSLMLLLGFILGIIGLPAPVAAGDPPKNVIFLIGDGMGFEQVKAASYYLNGEAGKLSFESFPHQAEMMTYSANSTWPAGEATDSAAAGSAMATGGKVNNGVVSVEIPGDGSELETVLEYLKARGKSTGLVTTTYITHATPACFGAHESDRGHTSEIASDYLNQTRPNVLFGGGGYGISVDSAQTAGYTVVINADSMMALNTETETMVSGQFGDGHMPYESDYQHDSYPQPHLSDMTDIALDILDNDPDGFFLMVEGGNIDRAGHLSTPDKTEKNIGETIEFSNAAQVVIDWAAGRTDTLIIVTADHECGGLEVLANNGSGNYPDVYWAGHAHTGVNVPVYAWGVNAEMVTGVMNNTDLFDIAVTSTAPLPCQTDFDGDGDVDGVDLYELVNGDEDLDLLDELAAEFGRVDCPLPL